MNLSLPKDQLLEYTIRQIDHLFPDGYHVHPGSYREPFRTALDRVDVCFKSVKSPRYFDGKESKLNHLYSDHYVVYLWYLANTLWKEGVDHNLINKLYYLNKVLHGFDCMFNTPLPDHFLVIHGSGTVLGKASYGDYFVAHQGCTVGIHDQKYPSIGAGVALAANSSIIGGAIVGNRVSIGTATTLFNSPVARNHSVYRDKAGKMVISSSQRCFSEFYFNLPSEL